MAKYLIVAHQTVTNPYLLDKLQQRRGADPAAEFTLLVPATPIHHLLLFKGSHTQAEAGARELADNAQRFREESLPVTETRVGAENPLEAIDTELTAHPDYAGIVISTLTQEHSRWLLLDLPNTSPSTSCPSTTSSAPPTWKAMPTDGCPDLLTDTLDQPNDRQTDIRWRPAATRRIGRYHRSCRLPR
jgi:hypothetical protein